MTAYATPADLATYLQTATEAEADAGNPDVLDTAEAILALDAATASIRSICGWSITEETVTDEPYPVERFVHLPTLHLTSVSISYDGTEIPATQYQVRSAGFVDLCDWRMLVVNSGHWMRPVDLLVTYTHGWPTVPDAIKTVCLERAAQLYVNPSQLLSETRSASVTVFARGGQGEGSSFALINDARLIPFKLPGIA